MLGWITCKISFAVPLTTVDSSEPSAPVTVAIGGSRWSSADEINVLGWITCEISFAVPLTTVDSSEPSAPVTVPIDGSR